MLQFGDKNSTDISPCYIRRTCLSFQVHGVSKPGGYLRPAIAGDVFSVCAGGSTDYDNSSTTIGARSALPRLTALHGCARRTTCDSANDVGSSAPAGSAARTAPSSPAIDNIGPSVVDASVHSLAPPSPPSPPLRHHMITHARDNIRQPNRRYAQAAILSSCPHLRRPCLR